MRRGNQKVQSLYYPEDEQPQVGLEASSPDMYQGKLKLPLGHGKCPV